MSLLESLCYIRRDQKAFEMQYLKDYRWQLRIELEFEAEGEAIGSDLFNLEGPSLDYIGETLPTGWKWVLQLEKKAYGKKKGVEQWGDWLYVASSKHSPRKLGLFAGREFPCQAVIGAIVGTVVKTASLAACDAPSEHEMNEWKWAYKRTDKLLRNHESHYDLIRLPTAKVGEKKAFILDFM